MEFVWRAMRWGFVALLLGWGSTWGAPPPIAVTERLDFEIRYGFINAGDAVLLTRPGKDTGTLEFLTLAHNNGFFETVYPVRDTVTTLVRKSDLRPQYYQRIVHEGGYHARSEIRFDWNKRQARLADSVFWDERGKLRKHTDTIVSLEDEVHCIISAFYKVRTLNLVPGKTWSFHAVSGKKKYRMRVICHGRDTVTVPAGRFPCLIVEPKLEGDGIFQAKGELKIWLTDDSRRIPVLMKSKIAVGSIRAELKDWKQGKNGNGP